MKSRHIEELAVGHFILYAASQGWDLWEARTGNSPVDFIASVDGKLQRVEVKHARDLKPNSRNRQSHPIIGHAGIGRRKLDRSKFDWLFANANDGRMWMIPTDAFGDRTQITLPCKDSRGQHSRYSQYEVFDKEKNETTSNL